MHKGRVHSSRINENTAAQNRRLGYLRRVSFNQLPICLGQRQALGLHGDDDVIVLQRHTLPRTAAWLSSTFETEDSGSWVFYLDIQ